MEKPIKTTIMGNIGVIRGQWKRKWELLLYRCNNILLSSNNKVDKNCRGTTKTTDDINNHNRHEQLITTIIILVIRI